MVIRHRFSAPAVLAFGAFLAGAIGIVSAMTPEFADRSRLVRGVLPPGVPDAARVLALAFGILLIWLSLGLARRKHRAWKLATALVIGSAVLHILKGLDFEETLVSLMLLAALWYWRDEFVARGDPKTRWPFWQAIIGLAAIGVLMYLRWSDHVGYSERLEDALIVVAALLATRALYFWLRPFAQRARSSPEERAAAEELVRAEGHDSLCYFALRRDKSYFFSPSGRSFLAYAVISGSAIVSGDPIGERAEFVELLLEFKRVALARAWRVGIINASEELLPVYRQVGLRAWYIGDEAIVRPAEFSLDGRPIRKVRQSVSRLEKSGYRAQVARRRRDRPRPAGRDRGGLVRVARPGPGARLLDGDGHALRVPGQRGRLRRGPVGPDRRLHPSRPLAGERRLLALDDAPARRRAERADGVPDRPGARAGRRSTTCPRCRSTSRCSAGS